MILISKPESERLVQEIQDWNNQLVAVDRENRIVSNVALTGLHSRNGHRYLQETLEAAVSLYEQKPVFLDHGKASERSTWDLVGSIQNPRFVEGRIRGEIQVLETTAGDTFLSLVEGSPLHVGMSQVVVVQRGSDPQVIEKIIEVISVDVVVNPATTKTFQESFSPWDQLAKENQRLESELRELRESHERKREIDRLLAESELESRWITRGLRLALQSTREASERKQLIAEHTRMIRQVSASGPTSQLRSSRWPLDEALISAIRGRAGL